MYMNLCILTMFHIKSEWFLITNILYDGFPTLWLGLKFKDL